LVPVVQQEYGADFSLALQAVHLRYSEAQQQLHQLTAAAVVAEAQVLPSVQAVRQQMDSLVEQAAHHQLWVAHLAASARTEPPIISLEL
jgi:hypothetical protein